MHIADIKRPGAQAGLIPPHAFQHALSKKSLLFLYRIKHISAMVKYLTMQLLELKRTDRLFLVNCFILNCTIIIHYRCSLSVESKYTIANAVNRLLYFLCAHLRIKWHENILFFKKMQWLKNHFLWNILYLILDLTI